MITHPTGQAPVDLPIHPTLVHPRTGQPLQALGVTKRGQLIWPVLGGDGTNDTGDSGQQQGQGQGQAAPATGQQQLPTSQPPAGQQQPEDPAAAIARLEKELATARAEAAKTRVNAKQTAAEEARQALLKEIGKALGFVQDDGPPDPAKLTQQLAAERERAAEALAEAIEYRVYRIAQRAGANAERLLDSRAFIAAVDELDIDPNDEQAFAQAVEAKVKEALERDPGLRAGTGTPAPQRQGADHTGAGSGRTRPTSLGAAIAARMTKGR